MKKELSQWTQLKERSKNSSEILYSNTIKNIEDIENF